MASAGGGYLGIPYFPISELYVREALAILVAGWTRLRTKRLVTPDLAEDNITAYLSDEMKNAQRGGVSDIINWDPQVGTQSNPQNPLEIFKIDIKFRWGQYPNDNDRYLAAEAKKLRGKGYSLAGDYVEEGVMRFVTARYGRGHNYGIMMGYVVVPSLSTAISRVKQAMDKRKIKTQECSALSFNNSLCPNPFAYHSRHLQNGTMVTVTLVHLFLDLS
jgi:hypothetical protein